MNDQPKPGGESEREEHAFERAFAAVGSSTQPEPFDAELVRRKARARSRVKIGGAALAVLLVAGGIVGGTQILGSDSTGNSSATSLPQPKDGWRWEFYRDIRLQVPAGWAYDAEPRSDWCVGNGKWLPSEPYIDLSGGAGGVMGIGCPGTGNGFSNEPPTDMWVEHATVQPAHADDQASEQQVDGWWVVRESVGDVVVKAVSEDRDLARAIVATAEPVTDDAGGCYPHSPIQDSAFPRPEPAWDLRQVKSVESITVCQYTDLNSPSVPGLTGVRFITGDDAARELEELKLAPVGGGPDHPNDCMPNDPGDSAIELRLDTGDEVLPMYVFYSTCHGNGFDDGTYLRELSADACQPLIEPPIVIWSGSSASFERCVKG